MQAIETEYKGPTNTRGSRIIAKAECGRLTVTDDVTDDVKAAADAALVESMVRQLRDCVSVGDEMTLDHACLIDDAADWITGEAARTAAAVAAATALCAKQCAEALERSSEDEREVSQSLREQLIAAEARVAELENERAGNHLVSFSAYDVMSRAERDRDALRASWREAVEVAERNAIDCVHLRHSAIALTDERDALLAQVATLQRDTDHLAVERSRWMAQAEAAEAQVEAARATLHRYIHEDDANSYPADEVISDIFDAMDKAKP